MARTVWTKLTLAVLFAASLGRAQDDEVLILDEISIEGQVREPSVAIFSSRMLPVIEGFRLEKSFFDQARSPDEELVELDPEWGREGRVENPEALLKRDRLPRHALTPLKTVAPEADQTQGSTKENGNDPAQTE